MVLGKNMILLSLVHTENNNYKDNDSIHTRGRYCLFIISASSSDALNSQARDSRIDYDWVSMFLQKNHSENDSNNIVSL